MTERKASDILLDVEKKVNSLESMIKLQDYQFKLIISTLNKILDNQKNQPKPPPPQKAPVVINEPEKFFKQEFPDVEDEVEEEELKIENIAKFDGKDKIPVFQKVMDKNKNPIPGALVLIKNQDGVSRIAKTNTKGKWQGLLPVGRYKITVGTTPYADGPRIQFEQTFDVIPGIASMEIPMPVKV